MCRLLDRFTVSFLARDCLHLPTATSESAPVGRQKYRNNKTCICTIMDVICSSVFTVMGETTGSK